MHHSRHPSTVAFVTDSVSPALSASDWTLLAPLRGRNIHVVDVPWEEPTVDWSAFDLVVLRSCWNYHRHLRMFHSWIDQLEAVDTRLWNPAPVIRWNLDKRYLRDLAGDGVAVVPTVWLDPGETAQLAEILNAQGWHAAVVKPRVSASAHGIWRTGRADAPQQQARLDRMLATSGALVQPLLPQIAAGEWSLVFFDGVFSHAALKLPGPGDIFVQQRLGGSAHPRQPDERLIEQAVSALHAATARTRPRDGRLLYTRVDGLDLDGRFVLLELELIEPGLFLNLAAPEAPARFAAAIAERCA